MVEIEIRKLRENEFDGLADLFEGVLAPSLPEHRKALLSSYNNPQTIQRSVVCLQDSKVVGGYVAQIREDPSYLHFMAVCSNHRRNGVGTELLKHFEESAKSRGCLRLELNADENNFRWYEKRGYIAESNIDGVICMYKDL